MSSGQEFINNCITLPAKTEREVIESLADADIPQLGMLLRREGRSNILAGLVYLISQYLSFVNLRQAMTPEQTRETAELLLDNFPYATIDTIKLFFKEAKLGRFGDHYGRMDGATLLHWFDEFYWKIEQEFEERQYQRHNRIKEGSGKSERSEYAVPMPDYIRKRFGIKTEEEKQREKQIEKIRLSVIEKNTHLYKELPTDDAIEQMNRLVREELEANGITE